MILSPYIYKIRIFISKGKEKILKKVIYEGVIFQYLRSLEMYAQEVHLGARQRSSAPWRSHGTLTSATPQVLN
jgi:hypothetical protein